MVTRITNSPYSHSQHQTSRIMLLVCLAAFLPIAVQFYFFGWGTLFQILLGCISALMAEGLVLYLRRMPTMRILADNSALLSGLLLAVSIPPLVPWWVVVLGAIFSIIIAKQLYGGLGDNLFNPAMIGYVVLLISFPVEMSSWQLPYVIAVNRLSFIEALQIIFLGHSSSGKDFSTFCMEIDGVSQATPLNTFKTLLYNGHNMEKIMQYPISKGVLETFGWKWINFAWLLGGLFLLWKRVIRWQIPGSFLATLLFFSTLGWTFLPNSLVGPQIHLLSGGTMQGAFFVLTDPVTISTTNRGRLICGALAAFLVWLIRSFGTYPDGVAFAVLLTNIAVPLIDYYTR